MDTGPQRLGAAIRERRQSLGMDHRRFAAVAGISETTLRNLEAGTYDNPQDDKLFGVDNAARAPLGSCDRILSGALDNFPRLPNSADLELARRIAALDAGDANLLGLLIDRLSA